MSQQSENVCHRSKFQQLFEQHAEDLYKFLYYKYGSENNPADLVQEAFTKLWNNCKSVPPEKAKSFLFTVANNLALNELDKKKTALKYKGANMVSMETNESPEFILEEKEYMNRLQNALASLSEAQRVAFMLNRVEGKRHKEIAEMLGISRKAVEKRIYTALAVLKEKMGGKI